MLLRVKNLGPVREAELDLGKPLIVLTGPNNSGKTYLAWAAYSLARLDSNLVKLPADLRAWASRLLASPNQALDLGTLFECRDGVLNAIADAVQHRLPKDFAVPRERFAECRLALLPSPNDGNGFFSLSDDLNLGTLYTDLHEISFAASGGVLRLSARVRGAEDQGGGRVDDVAGVANGVGSLAKFVLMRWFSERRYIAFPVERLAINLFARELAAARTEFVDELQSDAASAPPGFASVQGMLRQRGGPYPLVIRDALQRAIRSPNKAETSRFADLSAEIETSVLGGSIKLDAYDDPQFIPYQDPKKSSLGLHESASVVKSLVSLVLYLRYDAQPGQRLVIDEPELNLHPDNQRLIARILAKAVNRGLKIMMSTHSDYVIRELNNLIMLGQDSDEARLLTEELGYQPNQTLRPDQIGAYLVNDGACTPLEVTEIGFESRTIDDQIHKLNHDAQTIYFRLFDE